MQAFRLLAVAFGLLMLAQMSRGDDAGFDKPKDDKNIEIPPWVIEEGKPEKGKTSKRSPKEWYEWIYDNPLTALALNPPRTENWRRG